MTRDEITDLLDQLEGLWPETDGHDHECQLCGDPAEGVAIITDDGPVHTWHDLGDVLRYAIDSEWHGAEEWLMLAGWPIAVCTTSRDGAMNVRVRAQSITSDGEANRIELALQLLEVGS